MISKSSAKVCDDVDEQALDYAEGKALCAGDPLTTLALKNKGRFFITLQTAKTSLLLIFNKLQRGLFVWV